MAEFADRMTSSKRTQSLCDELPLQKLRLKVCSGPLCFIDAS